MGLIHVLYGLIKEVVFDLIHVLYGLIENSCLLNLMHVLYGLIKISCLFNPMHVSYGLIKNSCLFNLMHVLYGWIKIGILFNCTHVLFSRTGWILCVWNRNTTGLWRDSCWLSHLLCMSPGRELDLLVNAQQNNKQFSCDLVRVCDQSKRF